MKSYFSNSRSLRKNLHKFKILDKANHGVAAAAAVDPLFQKATKINELHFRGAAAIRSGISISLLRRGENPRLSPKKDA